MELLPTDILIDILCKLPVNSIISCRSACSILRNIITSNPIFAQLHYKKSQTQVLFRVYDHSYFSSNRYSSNHLELLELDHDLDETITISKFRLPMHDLLVLNSCNGFICLGKSLNYDPVMIYNPVTGEYINLPTPTLDLCPGTGVVSGFGFGSKTNQLKVVRIVYQNRRRRVEIYRLGENSWTNIGYAPDKLAQQSHYFTMYEGLKGVSTNGVFHWISDKHFGLDFIVTFDFETEKFGTLQPPPCFPEPASLYSFKIRETTTIGVLGGRLYVTYMDEEEEEEYAFSPMYIWVMGDYGVAESWTMLDDVGRGAHQALKYLKPGRILIHCLSVRNDDDDDDRLLGSYDIGERIKKPAKLMIEHPRIPRRFKAVAHVPSFCSFKDIAKLEFPIQVNKCW